MTCPSISSSLSVTGLETKPVPRTYHLKRESSAVTKLALVLHVIAGTIALFAGIVAMSSRKGAGTHRVAGTVFFVSMLIMAVFADYLAVAIPEQIPNLF